MEETPRDSNGIESLIFPHIYSQAETLNKSLHAALKRTSFIWHLRYTQQSIGAR